MSRTRRGAGPSGGTARPLEETGEILKMYNVPDLDKTLLPAGRGPTAGKCSLARPIIVFVMDQQEARRERWLSKL